MALSLHFRRKVINQVVLFLSIVAMLVGLAFLGMILFTLLRKGLPALSGKVFTEMTPPPGNSGGLLNAIIGSLMMTGLATLIGTPIGILAGTYLSEFAGTSRFASVVRFINSILLSSPSVVIGFFVYAAFVLRIGHFSGWSGVISLAVIIIPVVVGSTENMLRLVPNSLREAAAALGAPRWNITTLVVYQAAKSGILTGVLLGIARISGETAPLLFTALNNQFWSTDLNKPMANLPVVIFQFAMSPYEDWQHLAWAGALLITMSVLVLNVIARFFLRSGGGGRV
jgi:phosphate transport system permease protein